MMVDFFLIFAYNINNRTSRTSHTAMCDVSQGGHFLFWGFLMEPLKPPTTYSEQINILRSRGCLIKDENACEKILREINYYRLTAYFLPFRQSDNSYADGTTIERVYRIYEFDRLLRSMLLSVIEEVEIFLRTQLAYYHAHKYGAIGYQNPANFNQRHKEETFKNLWQTEIQRNQDVLFVKHYQQKYGGIFPIWVLVELFSFGMLSHFYSDLKLADQRLIANNEFGVRNNELASWLRCCTDLRNICAHYGRLYYRVFSAVPVSNSKEPFPTNRRLFSNILMLKYLYQDFEKWNYSFIPKISALIEEYQTDISLDHIGFPNNWEDILKK